MGPPKKNWEKEVGLVVENHFRDMLGTTSLLSICAMAFGPLNVAISI